MRLVVPRLGLLGALLLLVSGCGEGQRSAHEIAGADAERGRRLVASYACGVCHVVPGVAGAHGTVGPSLEGFAGRSYLAGRVPNEPTELVRWLADPPVIDPETAMPSVGLGRAETRDVAAYLYTLR